MQTYPMKLILLLVAVYLQLNCVNFSEAQQKSNSSNFANASTDTSGADTRVLLQIAPQNEPPSLDTLLAQAGPEVSLILRCALPNSDSSQLTTVRLPGELEPYLTHYWRESLRFKYHYLIESFISAEAEVSASQEFSQLSQQFETRLRESMVTACNGNRPITAAESDEVIRAVNVKAAELITQLRSK